MATVERSKQTLVQRGLRRPNWLCRNVEQNVCLCRDASGSMNGKKAADASAASLDLVNELAQPTNKDGFNVAVIGFASSSRIVHEFQKAASLDGHVKPLKLDSGGGSTNITASLDDALKLIENRQKQIDDEISYLRPVVILFTDGRHNQGPEPLKIATRLKQKADVVTVAFGADADVTLLGKLATTPQHCYRCANGRELRAFLAAVGATMTATMAAGSAATKALTMIDSARG